jgi:hypothetical protein
MPDTKITALAAITTVAPANDLFAIVDVSDNSMAASGTTKNITTNQILGAGGTATLASATITGDLTVDTSTLKVDSANNRVGIGTASPLGPFHVVASAAGFSDVGYFENSQAAAANVGPRASLLGVGSVAMATFESGWNGAANTDAYLTIRTRGSGAVTERYRIASDGVATWSNVGGVAGTAMTLNATGLGVGTASPAYKLDINSGAVNTIAKFTSNTSSGYIRFADSTAETGYIGNGSGVIPLAARTDFGIVSVGSLVLGSNNARAVTVDTSGNVGINVTPSNLVNSTRLEIKGLLGSNFTLRTASTNASARDWMVGANINAFGDFVIRQGNSQGAEPNSGTDRLVIDLNGNPIFTPSSTPATLTANGQLTVNATSNTNLRFSYRGSDGTTRVANITLA